MLPYVNVHILPLEGGKTITRLLLMGEILVYNKTCGTNDHFVLGI